MIKELAVGDVVIIFDGGGWEPPAIRKTTVVEVTSGGNYRLANDKEQLWNKSGRKRGATDWRGPYIEEFDQGKWDEISAQHQERHDRRKLEGIDLRKLPIEVVRKMLVVIENRA